MIFGRRVKTGGAEVKQSGFFKYKYLVKNNSSEYHYPFPERGFC